MWAVKQKRLPGDYSRKLIVSGFKLLGLEIAPSRNYFIYLGSEAQITEICVIFERKLSCLCIITLFLILEISRVIQSLVMPCDSK